MKKVAIIIFMLAGSVGNTDVLGQGAPKPNFGAKGGVNFANIGGESDNKLKTAFHAGIYSEVFFDYFLMMQMELLLSAQGHAADPALSFANSLSLWYIALPIMARYNIGYNFNVHTGIQLAFLMSAKNKFTDSTTGEKISLDVKDQLKGLDLSIPVGVGYDFMDRKFSATLRYMIPLSNINKTGSFKQTNSVFQISLGMKLFTMDDL